MAAIDWDSTAERDLWRAICAPNRWFAKDGVTPTTHPNSLKYFILYTWGVNAYFDAHPEQPRWFYEPIHDAYVSWLQNHFLRWKTGCLKGATHLYQMAVILPRGYGKTVTATKCGSLWCHLDEPDMSTLFCSATGNLSADLLKAVQSVMSGKDETSWFTWLYGDWRTGAVEWTKTHVLHHGYRRAQNISEPSFDTTSVDVGMTGYHHRVHIWDDPIYANKLREGRDAYMRAVHAAVNASYNAIQSNGLLMLVLTRYLDGDVAGRQIRDGGVASWSGMPCVSTGFTEYVPWGKGVWHVYFYQTEDEVTGEPTHPILWTKEKIAAHKRREPEDFASQQQNNPGAIERAPLREDRIPSFFLDYADFNFNVPVEDATVHLDTAFKSAENVKTGDDNVIAVWLHDARRNGILYLDTDLLLASNELDEVAFNKAILRTFIMLRRRSIRVRAMTDEVEPGGKQGTYKNRICSILRGSGFSTFQPKQFIQLNRTTNKKARIRTAAGHWAENYVRILLHKSPTGEWIIPPVLRKLIHQIVRIDTTDHDDIADATTDGFIDAIWRKPVERASLSQDSPIPVNPGDEDLKALSRRMTNEELLDYLDERAAEESPQYGIGFDPDQYAREGGGRLPWDT